MDLYGGRIEEGGESEEGSNAMVEQAVPGDGSGGAFIGIQVMPPHRRYSGAPPPSAIALMMTNSNNSWKAHRPTEWSSISPPPAGRKGRKGSMAVSHSVKERSYGTKALRSLKCDRLITCDRRRCFHIENDGIGRTRMHLARNSFDGRCRG